MMTKREGASPWEIVCSVRSAVSWSAGLRVVGEPEEFVVEVPGVEVVVNGFVDGRVDDAACWVEAVDVEVPHPVAMRLIPAIATVETM